VFLDPPGQRLNRIASRWRLAGRGCGRLPGTREIATRGASVCRATSMLAVIFASLPEGIVRAALRCPVLQRTGALGASGGSAEVLDSVQQAVQGRLVGPGAPQHRRIAHDAHLRVIEDAPHPGTRGTADGDHVGTIGHVPRLRHSCREPPEGVSCLHPFRVGRPVVA
jgi:hypothetical protein